METNLQNLSLEESDDIRQDFYKKYGLQPRDPKFNPLNVIKKCKEKGKPVFVAGPMVRYSKLPFRQLVRHFDADLVYSPMILAREFVRNDIARFSDFSTNDNDKSLIVQVGANNEEDLLKFVEMIHPFTDGIGLNCGCPIKEQVKEGIGAALMTEPDLVANMVKAVKSKYGSKVVLDCKIRIHGDINQTIAFVKKVEASGVDFITVHGRTKTTRSSIPANFEAIKTIKLIATVPVIANGDCFSYEDAFSISEFTGCDGVMAVRGILSNPAIFAGYKNTPWKAIELFLHYAISFGLPFRITQHHLSEMLDGVLPRSTLKEMNLHDNLIDTIDWFDTNFHVKRLGDEEFATGIEVPYRCHERSE